VIVYLWDACGPGQFRGVTDDEARARQAAEACLASGRASGAQVELAHLVTGFAALTSHYQRTGEGWRTRDADGRVTWVPFSNPELAAS
jgi:hypothetical protein